MYYLQVCQLYKNNINFKKYTYNDSSNKIVVVLRVLAMILVGHHFFSNLKF